MEKAAKTPKDNKKWINAVRKRRTMLVTAVQTYC